MALLANKKARHQVRSHPQRSKRRRHQALRQKGAPAAPTGAASALLQWTHGGVVFAPKPRDFRKKINKRMKDAAMRSVLSQKLREGNFIVIDKFKIEAPKTKLVAAIYSKIFR